MLKKIERRELRRLLKAARLTTPELENMQTLDVYHAHGWDHDIIFFEDDSLRNEHVPMREFYFDMKDMLRFFKDFLQRLSFSQAYIAPLYNGRFIGRPYDERYAPVEKEITAWLHVHGMRINSAAGMAVDKKELLEIAAMLSEAGFLGMSRLHVFIPEAEVVIEPHHHMNYIFFAHQAEEQKTLIREAAASLELVRLF